MVQKVVAGGIRQQHDKFVAANPGDKICQTQSVPGPVSGKLEAFVPGLVTRAVVYKLEIVDVDVQYRKGPAIAARLGNLSLGHPLQIAPVGDPGQGIVQCQGADLQIGPYEQPAQKAADKSESPGQQMKKGHQGCHAMVGSKGAPGQLPETAGDHDVHDHDRRIGKRAASP